jgi:hypothetical protein
MGIRVLKGYRATGVLQGFRCSVGVHKLYRATRVQ